MWRRRWRIWIGIEVNERVGKDEMERVTGLEKVVPDFEEGWKLVEKRAGGIVAHETLVGISEPTSTPAVPYRGFVGHELHPQPSKLARKEKRRGDEYKEYAAKLAIVS